MLHTQNFRVTPLGRLEWQTLTSKTPLKTRKAGLRPCFNLNMQCHPDGVKLDVWYQQWAGLCRVRRHMWSEPLIKAKIRLYRHMEDYTTFRSMEEGISNVPSVWGVSN